MRNDLTIIGREMTVFILAALFLALMILPIYIDVAWMNDALHETSFTETTQEIMLAVIAALFFIAAQRRPAQRGALTLVAGFYSCMLIRELDFVFDAIQHGSWIWFALAVTAGCLAVALRTPKKTLHALARLLQHRSWPVMASGFLVVLVFSRLFGIHALWQHLMLGDYNRVVKNMAEEGTELLGYGLCWLASVRYLWQTRPAAAAVSVHATESAPARHATSPVTSH
ncbi:hypothetical protein ABEH22_02655 [Pantoea agglomerans]|jgi:hypothetical protein|uniref:Uncharacterized protein n=2 Tax=Pantoea TaxID=53335 RepID=A0A379A8R4_ENTAG|nr:MULTISPECIES: hypothetical protein [Pantoea]MDF9908614.1 hypothetical protein [Pantoea brenneri]AYP21475.1 hypothetical protein D0A61_00135 [Pantoea agglomerans]ERM09314.1 hypothetical protein L584_17525 [Pantoea agglomerans Tx10]KAF6631092.1 hypothetical protein HFD95_16460 [Pantoea sp. EKM10T]KDA94100.1 hypothetical protein T296_12605 [Pantoea agglomerans Eh318]